MRIEHRPVTAEYASALRESVAYDAATGELTWISGNKAGQRAPTICRGYYELRFGGRRIPATHAIWVILYGQTPMQVIDHINGNGLDNSLENLREATISQNAMNKSTRRDSKTGFKGVQRYCRNGIERFHVRISVQGQSKWLGGYATAEAAHAAYVDAASKVFGEFAKG